ncbi:MAG: sulfatase-like hydrolase/transferase [Acidobacteriota bacterium]
MKMRNVILLLLVCCFGSLKEIDTHAAQESSKPNFILIMVDDMGRDWISCYGAEHRTPNVDRLAAQGVRFENAWCTPICTPTRVELLTGRYPFRTGWIGHHDVPRWGGKGLDWDKYMSFARVLKQVGYRTAIGGKWQINDFRKQPDALKKHGFDEHCVWTGYETGNAPPSDKRYWDGYLMTNGKRRVHHYGPDRINDFLVDFVHRNRDKPFLVYYPMLLTHGPHLPTPFNKDNPPTDKTGLYGGNVTYMDHLVGKLTKAVDDAGIADRTLIIFTGDNGSSASGSINGLQIPKGKGRTNDWGVHMPFIVRAPWLSRGERVSDDLLDFTDVLPTLAELAGAPSQGIQLDGRSFVSSISGVDDGKPQREWIYSQVMERRIIRDKQYKLDYTGAFWDLLNDPLETNDLRSSTDPKVVAARKRLSRVLNSMPQDAPAPFEGYRSGKSIAGRR